MIDQPPKLYRELATWWPLLSPPSEYAEEAAFFHQIFKEAGQKPPHTLLELGSGGGSNAWHLKAFYRMTLVDLAEEMLAVSRALNPECEHLVGDMRTVRLGRLFDAVFIHDAIMYMTTEADLRAALTTAYIHCRPGGVALFVPDHVRDTFTAGTEHGGRDGEQRGLRYLEWWYDPDERDSTFVDEFVYLLREGRDQVRAEYERHICGLFARADWLAWLGQTGFEARIVVDPYERELFVGIKPE